MRQLENYKFVRPRHGVEGKEKDVKEHGYEMWGFDSSL